MLIEVRVFGCRPALSTTDLADVETQRVGFVRNPAVCQVPGEAVAQASIRCRCPSVAPPLFGSAVPDSDADADSSSFALRGRHRHGCMTRSLITFCNQDAASRLAPTLELNFSHGQMTARTMALLGLMA